VVAMFDKGSQKNGQFSHKAFQGCFLTSFGSFGQAVSEDIFLEINQSETK
jgi:hypothetical protein